jgi:hypothetical protein
MPIMLIGNMKKIMERVLQESVEVGHIGNMEQLEEPKIEPKEVATFHNGEQNELEDVIKILNWKLYHLLKIIHRNCDAIRPNQKLHEN